MTGIDSSAEAQAARWDSTPYHPVNQREPKRTKENRKLNFAGWPERVEAEMVQKSYSAPRTGPEPQPKSQMS